jgi:hypothetical protein|tara:strand:- start:2208 stop:2807 length:600 start_codon:yes stop_codon:yes gene_type:complete
MKNFNVYDMKVGDSFEWCQDHSPEIEYTTTKISEDFYEIEWTHFGGGSYSTQIKDIIRYIENLSFKLLKVNFNPFTKSNLVSGEHVVETKEGNRYLVTGDYLIGETGYLCLSRYEDDLTYVNGCYPELSIMKVLIGSSGGGIHAGNGFKEYLYNENLKLIYDRQENEHRASQQAKLRSLEESIAEQQKEAEKLREELGL